MDTTATATISLLVRHPYSLPPPPPPPWPSFHPLRNRPFLLPLATSQTSLCLIPRHFRFRLFAIRSRNFDFSGLNFDDDKGKNGGGDFDRNKRRKRRSGKRSKKRRWWSVEDEEDDSVARESTSGTLIQVIDSIWIFKVLTSYGWFLPFIVPSLLLATGPKAFLIAFSIPLGLSLVILAFQKLWGWLDDSPKPRRRLKTRPPFSTGNDLSMEEDDDIEEEIQPKRINRRRDYRSWVVSSDNTRASVTSFGGWDDLITEKERGRARRVSEMGKPKVPVEEEKLNSRSLEERDLPLLLRLLVALFPFLGSLTDLL